MAWTRDGRGFFYARYAEPAGNALTAAVHNQRVFYHVAGQPQERDVLVYERPDQPDFLYYPRVTEDGRYLVLSVSQGSDRRNRLYVMDLGDAMHPRVTGTVTRMLDAFDAGYSVVGNDGPVFYLSTDNAAPRGRLIAVDLRDPAPARWRTVVPEGPDAISSVDRVNGRFVVASLHDVAAQLRVYNADGSRAGEVALPGPGAVGGLSGRNEDRELFFSFASFLQPSTVYRYDFATGRAEPVWPVASGFDASRYVTEQVFYTSRDGTRIPLFITHRRGMALDGNNPTLLYAYGGFNSPVLPSFSTAVAVWLEMGGVYASANLRGGNEYGEAWHQGGMLANKQNVFDDFNGAAEYLGDLERGAAGGRGAEPAAGAVRRGAAAGGGDGHAALQPLHHRVGVDVGLRLARRPGAVPHAVRVLAAAQHPPGNALPGGADHHRRPRRPGGARAQLQVRRDLAGGAGGRPAGADPHRDARRPWRRQAHLHADRRGGGPLGIPGEGAGDEGGDVGRREVAGRIG